MKKLATAVLLADIPEKNADLRYVCGFSAPDPVVVLLGPRRRLLIVNDMEAGRARRTVRNLTVATPDELALTPEEKGRFSGWILGALRRERLRRVRVGSAFPLGIARRLEAAGIRVDVSESSLFPERDIKTPREIRALQRVQGVAVAAMKRAVAAIRASVPDRAGVLKLGGKPLTAERLRADLRAFLMERQCIAPELIIACGSQGADPHQAGFGPLKANQSIVLDLFPQDMQTGYWGDLTRTVVKGTASPRLAAMEKAVRCAQAEVLRAVKPGARGTDLHALAVRLFEEQGFKTGMKNGSAEGFIHGTGHGVGLEIHERPTLGRQEVVLEPGNVVTVEPGLYYRAIGAIRIEDTVRVTRTGCEWLAACPRVFEI
jgi:Xaa-Pro aminopeptidase